MEKSVSKATRKRWEGLDDCLHRIGHKCPFGSGCRSYPACSLCISLATGYSLMGVLTRPIPNPDLMQGDDEVEWFDTVVKHAMANYSES